MMVHKINEPRAIRISEALNMAIKALEQEDWISVNDKKLPKIGERCIVSQNDRVFINMFDSYGFLCGLVDAWMPSPKPYKTESEE
jgi:hypothetical protein